MYNFHAVDFYLLKVVYHGVNMYTCRDILNDLKFSLPAKLLLSKTNHYSEYKPLISALNSAPFIKIISLIKHDLSFFLYFFIE